MALTSAQQFIGSYIANGTLGIAPGGYMTALGDIINANGSNYRAITKAVVGTSLFTDQFPTYLSNEQFAANYATKLLGTSVTAANMKVATDYITGQLNAGVSRGDAVYQVLEFLYTQPSTNADWGTAAATLQNKASVAQYYTVDKLQTSTNMDVLSNVLKTVTEKAESVTAVKAALDGVTGSTNEAGASYVLTTAQDQYTGTSGNDNFRAVAGNTVGTQDQTTLNSSDIIDGSTGTDALIVNLVGGNYNGGARIKNIETLQIGTNDLVARTFDYNVNAGSNEVTGVNTVKYDQITAGETLNIDNITPSATGNTIPVLHWANENGSTAGVAGATYRQASIAGTADNQQVILENVTGGDLNIARGIETLTITSSGTVAANTLTGVDAADGTVVDLVSENQGGFGVADDSTLTKVVVKGEKAFGTAAAVVTNDTAAETAYGLTNRAANGALDNGVAGNGQASTASNLVSVAATVTEIDATEANGGVAMRFTSRVDNAAVNVTFKGGKAADYIEFQRGNVNATGGEGADTFAFVNGNLSDFEFGSADSITGGAGSDTIQLGLNGNGTVVARTTEFNNKTGIDVLDLRANQSTVTLADALVAGADAGTFTVRTDKIYQTSATSTANTAPSNVLAANNNVNVALENNSTHTVVLTELADNRAVEFIGGSGIDRIVVDNAAANQFTKLDGGTNAAAGANDSLTVVNTAVLDANDVANIKGFELLNLVENTLGNTAFNVTLSEAFVLANTVANGAALNIASVTGTYGQRLGAGDTVTLEVTDLLSAGAQKASLANRTINVQDLIAAGVTVTFQWKDAAGATQTTTNAAPAVLATRFELAVAPAAEVLNDVAGFVAGGAGGAAAGNNNIAAVSGATNLGTNANDNFQLTVAGTTTVNGGTGTDSITFGDAIAVDVISAGAGDPGIGTDVTVTSVETLILGTGNSNLGVNDANLSVTNVTGSAGNNAVTLTSILGGGTIDLSAGDDTLRLNATVPNSVLIGGDGVDTLNLANGVNISTNTISGFEQIGIADNATVTLSIAQLQGFSGGLNVTDTTFDAGNTETITFSNAGTVQITALWNAIENITLANGTNTVTLLAGAHTVTGGTGSDSITGSANADSLVGGAGTDTLTGNGDDDTINGGAGADVIDAGAGLDTVVVAAGDTVLTIGGTGNAGTIAGFDVVSNLAAGTGTVNSETLNTVGTASVVASTVGTDGTDSTLTIGGSAVASHAITNGIITFDDAGTYANALTIATAADVAAVVQYLQAQDLGNAGATVAFDVGADTYVYTQGSDAGTDNTLDVLVQLVGVQATSLITTNATTANALFIA